jgi:hypothetical protein
MKISKYEKPVARDLDSVQPVQGSCLSGNVEYTVIGTCENGNAALIPCNTGNIPMNPSGCFDGSFAGYSCVDGSTAG